ncbi:ATP-binding protein [Candidatus Micrarchaeota archaeon]|nr:ATP-binding protein [Candidatus Micrarchaeota archaeon]
MPQFKAKLDTEWLSKIADFIEETANAMGCQNPDVIYDLKLAIDEASTNIMTHGKESQKKDHFIIQMNRQMNKEGRKIEVEIIDFGNSFPFDKIISKDGFGIHFIKRVTEKAEYKSFPDKNVLRFHKYF